MTLHIKAFGKSELARLYGVSRPTLLNWVYTLIPAEKLEQLKFEKNRKIFTVRQVEEIINTIGQPHDIRYHQGI